VPASPAAGHRPPSRSRRSSATGTRIVGPMWMARILPSAIRQLAVARLIDNTRHASLIGTASRCVFHRCSHAQNVAALCKIFTTTTPHERRISHVPIVEPTNRARGGAPCAGWCARRTSSPEARLVLAAVRSCLARSSLEGPGGRRPGYMGGPPAWAPLTVGGPIARTGCPMRRASGQRPVLFGVYVRVGVPTVSGIS
jgi:hypothetical protein